MTKTVIWPDEHITAHIDGDDYTWAEPVTHTTEPYEYDTRTYDQRTNARIDALDRRLRHLEVLVHRLLNAPEE